MLIKFAKMKRMLTKHVEMKNNVDETCESEG